MDDVSEPPSLKAQSFGHSFDPGSVEEPVRSDQETEVSVGKTHGDPSALLKRGVGHMDGPPSSAHRNEWIKVRAHAMTWFRDIEPATADKNPIG